MTLCCADSFSKSEFFSLFLLVAISALVMTKGVFDLVTLDARRVNQVLMHAIFEFGDPVSVKVVAA